MSTLTPLSIILNRMKRWTTVSTIEDQFLVRDLDESIRNLRKETEFPWMLQKGSLRVFEGVLEYPVAVDHDEIAYIDTDKDPGIYGARARFRFTSLQQFYENPDYRNDLAEIWDGNTRYLGVRYNQDVDSVAGGQLIDSAESVADVTTAGDAGTPVLDTVNFITGNASIRVPITLSGGTATVRTAFTGFADTNYRRKYFFISVYLSAVPTSIRLQLETDSSNYLYSVVTTQFSGQALKAGAWNLVAFDLNTASEQGTFDEDSIASQAIVLNGAATGSYNIDASYLRQWTLLDYWYYSKYYVALVGSTVGNQEYFMNDSEIYSTDSSLVGDSEWADVVMYDALVTAIADKENVKVMETIMARRNSAWEMLTMKYPDMAPTITVLNYRFIPDHRVDNIDTDQL